MYTLTLYDNFGHPSVKPPTLGIIKFKIFGGELYILSKYPVSFNSVSCSRSKEECIDTL